MTTPKIFLVIAAVVTLAGFASQQAQATPMPIVGLLTISGSGPAPGGESVSPSFFGVAVGLGANGSFSIIQTGAPVAIASPFIFLGSSVTESSLWSVGGFTLELQFGNLISDPAHHKITMSGMATIFAPGAVPLSGAEWTYTSRIGGKFNFRSTSSNLVPDSGTTMALLGLGLVAIAVCRAKFATS